MPAATATRPWTPPAAASSPPPVAGAGPTPLRRIPPAPPLTWDDDPYSDQPARAAASSSPRRLALLPVALAVSVAGLVFGTAIALVMLALVVAVSGHDGVSMGARSTPAVLAGAGFACAYAAAVLALWRGGRLHVAAVAVVWALAFAAVVSGAGVLGALVPVAGGALAVCLGAGDIIRRDPRPVIVLLAAACMLCVAAGALAPATRTHRPAPSAVVTPEPDAQLPAATATPSPAPVTTPAPTPQHVPAATSVPSPAPATTSAPTPQHASATPTPPAAATATPAPAATAPAGPTGATTAPAVPVSSADVAAATQLVRDFYAALDAHRFSAAWAMLPAAVHARFGGFDSWRAGYGQTISSRPEDITVSAAPGGLLVRLTLIATDRTACGPHTARFAVRWELVRRRTSWGAASLEGTPLGSDGGACG